MTVYHKVSGTKQYMKINNIINIFHFRLHAALLPPALAVWADQPGGDLRAGGGQGALQVSCDWRRETPVLTSDWSLQYRRAARLLRDLAAVVDLPRDGHQPQPQAPGGGQLPGPGLVVLDVLLLRAERVV